MLGGDYYLDNVDVGGVEPAGGVDPFFIAGLINSKVLNFVFQRISKPFRGKLPFRQTNSLSHPCQFRMPHQNKPSGRRAPQHPQEFHTARVGADYISLLAKRAHGDNPAARQGRDVALPNLKSKREVEAKAPSTLDTEGRRAWAAKHYGDALEALHEAIGQRLHPGRGPRCRPFSRWRAFRFEDRRGNRQLIAIFESEAEGTSFSPNGRC